MSFGIGWGKVSHPVTAVVAAIDSGQPKQVGFSARQLDNLGLERTGLPINVGTLQGMATRNKQKLPDQNGYPPVQVSANGVTEHVPVYNAFGRMSAGGGNQVRISEQLAMRLKVKIGDTVTISTAS